MEIQPKEMRKMRSLIKDESYYCRINKGVLRTCKDCMLRKECHIKREETKDED